MKRVLCVLLCLKFVLMGCATPPSSAASSLNKWMAASDHVRVLSTTGMVHDLVAYIGGERIAALCLMRGDMDPHSYEMVKGDGEKFSAATLIFYSGLGLEHGASLRYQLEHHPQAVSIGEAIAAQEPSQIIYVDGQLDPHVWMDVSLWTYGISPIVEALSAVDPEGRAYFEANGRALKQQMEIVHARIKQWLEAIPPSHRYLVTSHDAFHYFGRAYLQDSETLQVDRVIAPEGLAPDGQMSTSDIQLVVDHLLQYHIRVIFPESNVSAASLQKIQHACRKKGWEVTLCPDPLYGDALGTEGSGAGTYLEMMEYNAHVMCKEWK